MYGVFTQLENRKAADLSVLACDSGHDKSFEFLGDIQVIEALKDFILQIWDRVIFFKDKKHANYLIEKSLPLLDRIEALEDREKIGPEEASALRQNILAGTRKFVSSGAMIPEMAQAAHDPRELLVPEAKLLSSPPNTPKVPNSNEPFGSDLSPERIIQLKEVFQEDKPEAAEAERDEGLREA